MSPLSKSIYHTLAFFDAQDMPLTLLEIKSYLPPHPPTPTWGGGIKGEGVTDIESVLNFEISSLVEHKDGFYFLTGREDLVYERKQKYRSSLKNLRKAKKYLSFLRFFPYLRAVAISGSLAVLNSTQNSDLDLFVITKSNRIWLSRLLVSFYFQILGLRRHGIKIKGQFCLNHYVSEGATLEQDRNLYTAVEYANLIPVLGRSNLEKFWQENAWIAQYVPPPQAWGGVGGEVEPKFIQKIFEFLFEITALAPLLNYLSGLYQKHRIRLQEHILVSDSELSFHPGSRGQKVLARFAQKIGS